MNENIKIALKLLCTGNREDILIARSIIDDDFVFLWLCTCLYGYENSFIEIVYVFNIVNSVLFATDFYMEIFGTMSVSTDELVDLPTIIKEITWIQKQ